MAVQNMYTYDTSHIQKVFTKHGLFESEKPTT
jgi:hypothetical protein